MCKSYDDLKQEPVVSALIFSANLTAASKKSATLAKSSSTNPLDVRAGVPDSSTKEIIESNGKNSDVQFELGRKDGHAFLYLLGTWGHVGKESIMNTVLLHFPIPIIIRANH